MNHATLKKFVQLASKSLTGEWVIIGGTVMAVLGLDYRVTVDIDFVNLNGKGSNSESLKLMEIAETLGLPVEAVNQAGAYFLSKIDDAREHLVEIQKGPRCTIYRPDVYLFVRLKLGRFTQTDLDDCLVMIENHPAEFAKTKKEILKLIQSKLGKKAEGSEELRARLLSFKAKLAT